MLILVVDACLEGHGGLLACLDAIAHARVSFAQNVTPLIALDGMVGRLRQACGAH